jgi:hypothetical protein
VIDFACYRGVSLLSAWLTYVHVALHDIFACLGPLVAVSAFVPALFVLPRHLATLAQSVGLPAGIWNHLPDGVACLLVHSPSPLICYFATANILSAVALPIFDMAI